MNVTYHCPACHKPLANQLTAPRPRARLPTLPPANRRFRQTQSSGDHINRCLVCPSTDLFARKDFPSGSAWPW